MQFYFAPLEGITGYIYRNAFHVFFGEGMTKYFTPFIATAGEGKVKKRSLRDVMPENNNGLPIVPQLLSNNWEDFSNLCHYLKTLGYEEVNLNLGCPYGTVVSKGKGAGFLGRREQLKEFLDRIFEKAVVEISVKTRIGIESCEEFETLLELYHQYPLKELIIHPRVQKDFYGNKPRMAAFEEALRKCKMPVCYNGDIFTVKDYRNFTEAYPLAERIMIGRGFLTNPAMLRECGGGKPLDKETLLAFHNRLYEEYLREMGEDKNTLFKMKELWNYWQYLFLGNEREREAERHLKQLKKAGNGREYRLQVQALFRECELVQGAGFPG